MTTGVFIWAAVWAAGEPAVVFDARALTWDERCTVEALQGLVNRRGPRLYLDFGYPWDRKWLEIYAERNGLRYEEMSGMRRLLERFAEEVKGLVVYDAENDGARCVALTLAGVEDLLPVTPAVLSGRSPALAMGDAWSGWDFAAEGDVVELLQAHAGARVRQIGGQGLEVEEDNPRPDEPWSFVSFGPVTVDLGQYPVLEVVVTAVEPDDARFGIKLTWDRNGDGENWGPEDDLVLPTGGLRAGTHRWNVAELAGIRGRHTLYRIQLHALGHEARVVFRAVRFVSPDGRGPAAAPPKPLTELGLPVRYDLRGRFRDSVEAYRWALREVMPRCNRRFAHAVNGAVEGVRAGCGPFAGFDWPVMHRGF
ncbi:MAG: hypothetical protein H5T86_13925, partial [Armatimonadetes bacterium]|nr:hypothetical protein [Armatimonadota bacterium]